MNHYYSVTRKVTHRTVTIEVTPDEVEAIRARQPDTIRQLLDLAQVLPAQPEYDSSLSVSEPRITIVRNGKMVIVDQSTLCSNEKTSDKYIKYMKKGEYHGK